MGMDILRSRALLSSGSGDVLRDGEAHLSNELMERWKTVGRERRQLCSAKDCKREGEARLLTFGKSAMRTYLCFDHFLELVRLRRDQGKDWGRNRGTGEARLYYASRCGFHAY